MDKKLAIAIDKYLKGEASENEQELVDSWYQAFEARPGLMDQLSPEEAAKAMAESFARISGKLNLL